MINEIHFWIILYIYASMDIIWCVLPALNQTMQKAEPQGKVEVGREMCLNNVWRVLRHHLKMLSISAGTLPTPAAL